MPVDVNAAPHAPLGAEKPLFRIEAVLLPVVPPRDGPRQRLMGLACIAHPKQRHAEYRLACQICDSAVPRATARARLADARALSASPASPAARAASVSSNAAGRPRLGQAPLELRDRLAQPLARLGAVVGCEDRAHERAERVAPVLTDVTAQIAEEVHGA